MAEGFVGNARVRGLVDRICEIEGNVALVLDKSGSMNDPLGAGTRWSAMKTAVGTALDQVKGTLAFGLEFFPNAMSAGQTCDVLAGEAAIVIPIGPGATTVPQIVKAFDANPPGGGTPTATALARAYDYFTIGGGKDLPGDRFVLLATDGGPDCNPSLTCPTDSCTVNLDDPQRTCGPRTASGGAANCCDSKLPFSALYWVDQVTPQKAVGLKAVLRPMLL